MVYACCHLCKGVSGDIRYWWLCAWNKIVDNESIEGRLSEVELANVDDEVASCEHYYSMYYILVLFAAHQLQHVGNNINIDSLTRPQQTKLIFH